jgi:hypothetical protein
MLFDSTMAGISNKKLPTKKKISCSNCHGSEIRIVFSLVRLFFLTEIKDFSKVSPHLPDMAKLASTLFHRGLILQCHCTF